MRLAERPLTSNRPMIGYERRAKPIRPMGAQLLLSRASKSSAPIERRLTRNPQDVLEGSSMVKLVVAYKKPNDANEFERLNEGV
jgi:hypothetical protein